MQAPTLQLAHYSNAEWPAAAVVIVFGAAESATAVVLQSAVAVVLSFVAAVSVSGVELFVTAVLVVHDAAVAAVVAEPQALLTASAGGHCFAAD